MFKKFLGYTSFIVPIENVGIKDILSYKNIPVQILDRQVRKFVWDKFHWRNNLTEEACWEAKKDMKKRYPYLFESG